MNRLFPWIGCAFAAGLAVTVSGCGRPSGTDPSHAAQPSTARIDRVTAGHPERKTLTAYTTQPGRVEAFEETPLFPKVAGYVERVLVDIGDSVQKDQVLIKLWIPELQDDLEQKNALVAQADAQEQQAQAALRASKAAVDTALARVSQAEAGIGRVEGEYNRWVSEHQRIKELAAKGSVTQKLVDETLNQLRAAEAARDEAQANVQSATAGWKEAQANLSKAEADLVAAQASCRVAHANLAQAKTMLGYSEIKAPFDGVVTRRGVDTKHYVHPAGGAAANPLLVVASMQMVRVFVDVPEMEAPLVDIGDPAVVRVQSLGNQEFPAEVTRTSWSLDASNRSLRTEIDVHNDDGSLRPGMFATTTILLERRDAVLALPITAIVRDGQQAFCCCVENGRIERRPIELGLRSGDEVEVVSGLEQTHMVVLTRGDALEPGHPVSVIQSGE